MKHDLFTFEELQQQIRWAIMGMLRAIELAHMSGYDVALVTDNDDGGRASLQCGTVLEVVLTTSSCITANTMPEAE